MEPYLEGILPPVEELRNLLATGIGNALRQDKAFREELFDQLTDSERRALVSVPVLKILKHSFTSGTGATVINAHLPADETVNFRSGNNLATLVDQLEPTMTLELPIFVRSYFLTESTIDLPVSALANLPLAAFPETSNTNDQGVFVGYGDVTNVNENGIYGIYPAGSYDGYIPIHVKKSRTLTVIENGMVYGTNVTVEDYVSRKFPNRPPSCLVRSIPMFSDSPDFLNGGKSYFDIASFSKAISSICPSNPFVVTTVEICNNGIDDDEDGLIDGEDPDCFGVEICNNGIDDDGDGSIDQADADCGGIEICGNFIDDDGDGATDSADSDCGGQEICDNGIDDDGDGDIDEDDSTCLSCPDDAVYYRDCEVNTNRITGGRFDNVGFYTSIINPLLPGLETQVNLTLSFFRIENIENCGEPCPLQLSYTNQTSDAVSVFLNGEIQLHPFFQERELLFDDQYEYFEDQYDENLSSGRVAYFLVMAHGEDQDLPSGAINLGRIGGYQVLDLMPELQVPIHASVVTPNWVNYATPSVADQEKSDGIDYVRISDAPDRPDWDVDRIGDRVRMDVAQTDLVGVMSVLTDSETNSNSQTFSAQLTSSTGNSFGVSAGSGGGPNSSNTGSGGFTFGASSTSSNSVTSTAQYTLTSERIINLYNVDIGYRAVPDKTQYPIVGTHSLNYVEIGGPGGFGTSQLRSYGYTDEEVARWDRNPFSLSTTSSNPYQIIGEGDPIRFINVIRAGQ